MFKTFFSLSSFLIIVSLSSSVQASNDYYEQALQAFNESKYEASYLYLKNALEQDPRDLPSKILMGKLLLRRAYFDEAITEFEEALAYRADMNLIISDYSMALNYAKRFKEVLLLGDGYNLSKDSQYEWLLNKGIAYQNLDLTELARQTFEDAMSMRQKDVRAYNTYASFEMAQGNFEPAERLANQSLELNPNDHRTMHLIGTIRHEKNDYKGAIQYYLSALQILPNDPVVRRSLVQSYIQTNQIAEAKALVKEILDATPNDPHMMLMASWLLSIDKQDDESAQMLEDLANTATLISDDEYANRPSLIFVSAISSFLLNKMEQAEKELQQYLSKVPGDTRAISLLSKVYIKQDKEQEAQLLLERYESNVIKDKSLAVKLVDLYDKNGKRFDAERLLRKLQLEYPGDVEILLRQVDLLNRAGRSLEAKRIIDQIELKTEKSNPRLELAKALMYLQSRELDKARKSADELNEQFPNNLDLLNFKTAVLIKQGLAIEAQQYAEKTLAIKPDFFEGQFNLATALKMQSKIEKSQEILEALIVERPTNNEVKYMLSETYVMTGKHDKAIPLLESVTLGSAHEPSKSLLFDIYYSKQQFQDANRIIRGLTDTNLYNIDYLFKHVKTLKALNRLSEAKQKLGILYGLAESNARLLYDIAVAQRGIKDFTGAKNTIGKLKNLVPKNLRVRIEEVRLLQDMRLNGDALKLANGLQKSFPNNPNVLMLMGDIQRINGERSAAFDFYWQALEQDENFNLALMNIYQLSKDGMNVEKVTSKLESLAKKFPNDVWRKKLLADHYINQNEFQSALLIYSKLIEIPQFARDPMILNNLATIHLDTDIEKAFEYAKRAQGLESESPAILDTIGWIYYKQARFEEALQSIRNAYSMNSSSPTIRFHLGSVLAKLGRNMEAKQELNFAIKNANGAKWLNDAKALLESL